MLYENIRTFWKFATNHFVKVSSAHINLKQELVSISDKTSYALGLSTIELYLKFNICYAAVTPEPT